MLSEVMEHYGLVRDFMGQAAFFETEHARHMLRELKLAIKLGKLVVLSGIGGCGKTTMLRRVQESMEQEKEILVSKALSVEKSQIHLGGLIVALFTDLATDKDVKIPTQPERRERALRDLVRRRQKPIALLIDDAHDLHPKTLLGLKRLIEVVRDGGGTLSVVLAGHPRLKNSLERPAMEEIGSRATIFELDGIRQEKPRYIEWLIKQCAAPKTAIHSIVTEEALARLAERLSTPLQIERHLSRALEEGYKVDQKPVSAELIDTVIAQDIDDLEPRLTRQGYHMKALAELLSAKPAEIRLFLRGQLATGRTQELHRGLLAAGIAL
jgi:type II secretory pathway predicted ATPase ExeA